jgi:hypothetical protein
MTLLLKALCGFEVEVWAIDMHHHDRLRSRRYFMKTPCGSPSSNMIAVPPLSGQQATYLHVSFSLLHLSVTAFRMSTCLTTYRPCSIWPITTRTLLSLLISFRGHTADRRPTQYHTIVFPCCLTPSPCVPQERGLYFKTVDAA